MTISQDSRNIVEFGEFQHRENSALLKIVMAHVSHGLSMFDADGLLVLCNERYGELYDIPPKLLVRGTSIMTIAEHLAEVGYLGTDEPDWPGSLIDNSNLSSVLKFNDGRIIRIIRTPVPHGGWVATHEDVTEQINAKELLLKQAIELALTNMRFGAALSNMTQGLCMFDAEKKLVVSNRAFKEMYRLSDEQVRVGSPARDMLKIWALSSEDGKTVDEQVAFHAAQRHQVYRLSDGRVISIKRTATSEGGWVATHDDITERERIVDRVNYLAFHDTLTGLANRVQFSTRAMEALARAARRGKQASILLIDLDRFKDVNDTLGHAAGDQLLQLFSERIRQSVRENDVVARLGGDEFAIFQDSEANQFESATSLAKRLLSMVEKPFDLGRHQVLVGASIGVALTGKGDSVERMMRKADLALYEVKAQGRNSYRFYDEALGTRARERHELEADLHEAIARNEIELHYQPIVSLSDERICGMEALARWRHPSRGLLLPEQFIPLAEDMGLIAALGELVIQRACADAARWPEPIKVAVNVSPSHLKKRSLLETVTRTLSETGLPPERLEMEVTETVLLQNDEDVLAELHQIRNLGISIALDDFGTGFSSLSHLRMFCFDRIKIDKSFVAEITSRSDSAMIVSAVLGLARNLDMNTTAEGIETRQQLDLLKIAGCSCGQGYLFGRPLPASEIPALNPAIAALHRSA